MADRKLTIALPSIRLAVACAMTIGALVLAASAEASTLYTYSFTQDGYFSPTRPDQDITGVLSGSFSFAGPPSTGIVGKADLVDFSFSFTEYLAGQPVPVDHGDLSNILSFSFNPKKGGSLFLQTQTAMHDVCVGAAASFGLCGLPTGFNGAYAIFSSGQTTPPDVSFLVTQAGPELTLTSVTPPPVATTPIPPALPLFASCLGVLGFIGWRRSQSQTRGARERRAQERGRDRSRPLGLDLGAALV
ncbi:MAG TPA: hypothetical protein VHA35_01990 [Dongiaceae bacterium]|nr:hypothetical protein [Dongiaceae bacterium]